MRPTSRKPTTLIAMRHGGTHLIQPIIRQITGQPVSTPKGETSLDYAPGPKLVIFARDPRNRMVSHFRYKNPACPPDVADHKIARLMALRKGGATPVEFMLRWAERWCGERAGYRTSFERLMLDPLATVELIREYLDAPGDAKAAFEFTLGKSGTWTGRHSRWQEWFGPESMAEWTQQGGDRLVRLMGYGDD